jgi:hypothetical protein
LDRYRALFEKMGVPKTKFAGGKTSPDPLAALSHCHWMLDEIVVFLAEDRREKAMRWLGFLQGVLWEEGEYSIDDLMKHNFKEPD